MSKIYYYVIGDKWKGPVKLDDLKILVVRNELNGQSLIWTEGYNDWQKAIDIPDFSSFVRPPLNAAKGLLASSANTHSTGKELTSDPNTKPDLVNSTNKLGECFKCKTINPGDNRFCSECGTLLYKACPSCNIENRLGTKFCGKCGADVAKHERINIFRQQAADLIEQADRATSDKRLLLTAACQRLKSALEETPKDEAISQELIQLEVRIREMDRALNEATVKIAEIIEAGKFSEALKMVNESISKLEPSSDLAQLQRKAETGVTLLNQINAHKQGNKAVDACQKMLEVFPSNKEAKGQLDGIVRELETIKKEAIGLIESGSYRQAISKLDHCLKSFEGEMGQPLSVLKDLSELREKAQAYENRVKELSAEEIPSFVRKHAFVGVLKALKELGELKADLSGFIKIREQACSAIHEATILVNQASHLHRSKKLSQARDAFLKASDLCSDLPRIHPGLVLVNQAIDSAWNRNAAILVATCVVLLLGLRYSTLAYLDWRENQAWEEVQQGIQSAGPDQAKIKICYQQYLVKHPAGKWVVDVQKTLDKMARDEDARLKKLAEDQKNKLISKYMAAGLEKKQQGDFDAAATNFDLVINIDPDNSVAYWNKGLSEMGHSNFVTAVDCFSNVIVVEKRLSSSAPDYRGNRAVNLKDSSLYLVLGLAEHSQGDDSASRKHIQLALDSAVVQIHQTGNSNADTAPSKSSNNVYFEKWLAGSILDAHAELDKKYDNNNQNRLLYLLERGAMLRAEKNYKASNDSFKNAEEEDDRICSKYNQSPTSDCYDGEYFGKYYDFIMLNTYKALNYLAMGDQEKTRPEIIRAYQRQQDAYEWNKKQIEREQAEHKDSVDQVNVYGKYVNPITCYLDGLYFMANAADNSDLERANKSFERVSAYAPDNAYVKQDLAAVTNLFYGKPLDPTTYVIFETGCAPQRRNVWIDIPQSFLKTKKGGAYIPILENQQQYNTSLNIDTSYFYSFTTQPLADMDEIVATAYNIYLPFIVSECIQFETNSWYYDSICTRNWSTLPKCFQTCRFSTPDWIKLTTPNGQSMSLKPLSGKINVVYVKSISDKYPLIVSQFTFK